MAINTKGFVYPFNPEGNKPECLITGERQILNPVNGLDYNIIVPKRGPYFSDSLRMTFRTAEGIPYPLVLGKDWYPSHHYIAASRACAADIYGSISFIRPGIKGEVTLEYQTLGGNWVIDEVGIAALLADTLHNPRITSYEQVVNPPQQFPVIDHEWDLVDMVGQSEKIEVLKQIVEALLQRGEGGLAAHVANRQNPHGVDKAQVGLSDVQNMPLATPEAAAAGVDNFGYMTPRLVAAAIAGQAGGSLTAHVQDMNNPHHTDAAATGAYFKTEVDNLLAKKLDKTGAAADSDKFGGNTPIQFKSWVLQGTADNSIRAYGMTLPELKLEIQGGASADSDRLGGLTPDELMAWILTGTAANAMRLNGRTDAQLKAWALQGTADNSTRFAGMDKDQLATWVNAMDAANALKFGGMTPDQFRASVASDTAANSLRFEGKTYMEAKQDFLQGTAANSVKFNGKTEAEFLTQVSTVKASDSARLNGKNEVELTAAILSGTANNTTNFAGFTEAEWREDIYIEASKNAAQTVISQTQGQAAGSSWVLIGQYEVPKTVSGPSVVPDFLWFVHGGDAAGETTPGRYYLRGDVRRAGLGVFTFDVQDLVGSNNAIKFGWVKTELDVTTWVYSIYAKVGQNRSAITITELGAAPGLIADQDNPSILTIEPVGITYATVYGGGLVTSQAFSDYQAKVDSALLGMAATFDTITALLNKA